MIFEENKVSDIKIAYIGGGSRGWAWGLMSDLASCADISGTVALYDIDNEAAQHNEVIGNKFNALADAKSHWEYKAVPTLASALQGANFVVISILPGTFDEMESDVHTPEKYGIYQSVGDTTGPGGVIRALRTIPMMEEIALAIKEYAPSAWVINYTNPMTVCIDTLYRTFPGIKAFGCCHEVFGTQKLLASVVEEAKGCTVARDEVKVNVVGINHFTWLTQAHYRGTDIFPLYQAFCEKYKDASHGKGKDDNWMNNSFASTEKVKMDLFRRYGYIAAAGDRHLAEFCDGAWYLKDPQTVADWQFGLTPVSWRKEDLKKRLQRSADMVSGAKPVEIKNTGEEGTNQIRALLGLQDLVTNVNIPNRGQIPNLPLGAVVETNAVFRSDSVTPVLAGEIPMEIYALIARIVGEQQMIVTSGINRDLNLAFQAFAADPLTRVSLSDAKKLFDEMIGNTKKYLTMYQ